MDAAGTDGDGDVGAGVEEQAGRGRDFAKEGEDLPGQAGEVAGGEIGLAKEEEVDAGDRQAVSLGEQMRVGAAGDRQPGRSRNRFLPGEQVAVGDAVAQHGLSLAVRRAPRRALR